MYVHADERGSRARIDCSDLHHRAEKRRMLSCIRKIIEAYFDTHEAVIGSLRGTHHVRMLKLGTVMQQCITSLLLFGLRLSPPESTHRRSMHSVRR